MYKRWYDNDPTLSMAISLLQNASYANQELAAKYIFNIIEQQRLLNNQQFNSLYKGIAFIFPNNRNQLQVEARRLVEELKHLPSVTQESLALVLINYIYVLDQGLSNLENQFDAISDEPFVRFETG